MTGLEETLAALSAALPEASGGVESVLGESRDLERTLVDLLAEIRRDGSRAGEVVEHVERVLGELRRTAAAAEVRLAEQADVLDAGWSDCEEAIGRAQDGLDREALDASAAASTLTEGALSDARRAAKESEASATGALEHLWAEARSVEGQLGDALAAAGARAESLQETVDAARTRVSEAVSALGAKMESLLERARETLLEGAERLDRLHSAHDAHLPEQTAVLVEAGETLLSDLGARLADMVEEHVVHAVDDVLDPPMSDLVVACSKAEKDCAFAADALEKLFESAREDMRLLFDAVCSVRSLALEHGFDWAGSDG